MKTKLIKLSKTFLQLSLAVAFFWMFQGYAVAQEEIVEDQDGSEETLELCTGNLIANGGFEEVDDTKGLVHKRTLANLGDKGPKWDIFNDLPDGKGDISWFTDYETSGIEVQFSGVVVSAYEGNHYVELDSHKNKQNGNITNSAMTQELDLEPGSYLLEFAYRPRTKKLDDNAIAVYLNDEEVHYVDAQAPAGWELIILPIEIEEDGVNTLTFEAAGKQNTLGGFVDAVALYKICPPEEKPETPEAIGPNVGQGQTNNPGNSLEIVEEVEQQTLPTGGDFIEGSGCSLLTVTSPATTAQALGAVLLLLGVPGGLYLRGKKGAQTK